MMARGGGDEDTTALDGSIPMATATTTTTAKSRPFRIRTITAFVNLRPDDFDEIEGDDDAKSRVAVKVERCNGVLRNLENKLVDSGYEVQTVRIATNPFGEWLTTTTTTTTKTGKNDDDVDDDDDGGDDRDDDGAGSTTTTRWKKAKTNDDDDDGKDDATTTSKVVGGDDEYREVRRRLLPMDSLLGMRDVGFCSLGPSTDPRHTKELCPIIVASSVRFSCSANVESGDVAAARAAAECMIRISTLDDDYGDHVRGGLGNFRFCASSRVVTVPFFPGARSPPVVVPPASSSSSSSGDESSCCDDDRVSFSIGLENGGFARCLLEEAGNIGEIKRVFDVKMRNELLPIQDVCSSFADDGRGSDFYVRYLGIDTSLNPSLDDGGSVADAVECLEEVRGSFGGTGSLAAAAAVTTSIQSIPGILTTGYCGLMLPVLEDRRLAELAGMVVAGSGDNRLTIDRILCISSVCGVGVDTVPIPGNVATESLTSLILDVAALAGRWNKPLSCRVFPVPGKVSGEMTTFDSPYMCNSRVFDL